MWLFCSRAIELQGILQRQRQQTTASSTTQSSSPPKSKYLIMLNCINTINVHQLFSTSLDLVARRVFPGQNGAFALSLFLFTFMVLPTLVMLLAVIVFFAFYYPRLGKLTAVHDDDY